MSARDRWPSPPTYMPPLPAAVADALHHAFTVPRSLVMFLEAHERSARDRFDDLCWRLARADPDGFSTGTHSGVSEVRLRAGSLLRFHSVGYIGGPRWHGIRADRVLITSHAWDILTPVARRDYARLTAHLGDDARPVIPEL